MRQLFADREFLAYFLARQSSSLAYSVEGAAVGWQIFALRHRALDLGLVGLILFLPQLLLAFPAGMIADRFDRRIVCVIVALFETAGLALYAALALAHVSSVGPFFAAAAFIGVLHAIGAPAERSLLAGIVQSAHFVRAQAFSQSAGQVIKVAGPAVGGALIAFGGTPLGFAVSGAAYLLASAGFALLTPREVMEAQDVPLLHSALEGVRFIFERKVVLGAISLDLFAVLFGGSIALLPVYATSILGVGPTGFGALRAAPALGAAVVALYIARRPITRRAGPLLFWCVAGFGAATIVFGVSKNFWLSLAALALTGGFDMVSMVIRSVLVQLRTPDAMRGRVNAVENIFIGASNELGEFESGTLAAFAGAEASVVLGGIATLAVIAIWAGLFPALRRFDRLSGE